MTTRVKIENLDAAADHRIKVKKLEYQQDQKHHGVVHVYDGDTAELGPGESLEWYLWGEQKIEIREIP